jgi:hypothetical protein
MSSKTVNEDLLIVTQGSKHKLDTVKPTDLCFLVDKKTIVPYRNHIPSAGCDNGEATQKTLIRGFRIVHNKSRVGTDYGAMPSTDDNFQGFGGGVANGQVFFKHANDYPGDHSKNVKVEGKWIVRTGDETQQNKRNCTGKFVEGDGGITEDELEALLNKGCTVESTSMVCDHGRDTTTDRIGVLEGGVVTVTMVHVNDAEVDPGPRAKPVCQVPRRKGEGKLPADAQVHPHFRVTRSAYPKTSWREALPAKTEIMPGLKIDIGKPWLGEGPKKEEKSKSELNKDPKDKPKTIKDTYDKIGKVEGAPPLEGARMLRDQKEDGSGIPAQQARGKEEAHAAMNRDMELRQMREAMANQTKDALAAKKARDAEMEKGRENTQSVIKAGSLAITTYYALKEVFYAKPVEVKVEALACAGAKPVTIAAYPPGSYGVNLIDLKEFKTAFKAVKDTIAKVRDFLKKIDGAGEKEEGAAADVAITAGRFTIAIWVLKDAAAELNVEFRELTRDSAGPKEAPGRKKHEVFRAFIVDLKLERIIGLKFSYSIPVSYATGAIGAFAQKLLDKVGADLAFKFEVELSVGVSGQMEYNEYGAIIWARKASITPFAKFTISLNASARGFSMSIGASIEWKPTFEMEPVHDQPFVVKRKPSTVDIKWFVKASINILGWTVDWQYGDTIWTGKIPEAKYTLS